MNIAVFGAKGRVGKKVTETAEKRGHKVWEIDKNYENQPMTDVDAVIDFSTAQATEEVCGFCKKFRCPLITGVTGRNDSQEKAVKDLEKSVKVIQKANFSQGVNVLEKLCEKLAEELKNWDCEIVETHRKGKPDSPSGTAKRLAGVISKAKGSFSTVTVHSVRAGSNFGRHEIVFATNGESLTVTHQAESVEIFALGAVIEAEKAVK